MVGFAGGSISFIEGQFLSRDSGGVVRHPQPSIFSGSRAIFGLFRPIFHPRSKLGALAVLTFNYEFG